jgi:hypothetical protein
MLEEFVQVKLIMKIGYPAGIVADNVFGKGAALNAVQILELMKKTDEN